MNNWLLNSTSNLNHWTLIPDFNVPEFKILSQKMWLSCSTFLFSLNYIDLNLQWQVLYDIQNNKNWEIVLAKITIMLKDWNNEVLNFNTIFLDEFLTKYPKRKKWIIKHKKVNPKYRRNGLWKLGFKMIENAIKKLSENFPSLQTDTIEISLNYWSTSRLIIDQSWLIENNLSEYLHKDGTNIGYRPYKVDNNHAIDLIHLNTENKIDAEKDTKTVRFYKNILPNRKSNLTSLLEIWNKQVIELISY